MRGKFIRGDGLEIPNNVSLAGAEVVLKAAFRLTAQPIYAALVAGAPTLGMTMLDMVEPTLAINGYSRIAIPQSIVGWPVVGTVSSEKYIETDWLTWTAVVGNFDQPIQRVALIGFNTYSAAHEIFALSVMMPNEITITPATDLALRRFKYQFFL